jgi:hypothetical protein
VVLTLILGLGWAMIAATALALPARYSWAMAWALIATGIPLLGALTMFGGPVFGLVGLVIAGLLLARAIRAAGLSPTPRGKKI